MSRTFAARATRGNLRSTDAVSLLIRDHLCASRSVRRNRGKAGKRAFSTASMISCLCAQLGRMSPFMIDFNPGIEQSGQTLIFTSGKGKSAFPGLMVVAAILAFATLCYSTPTSLRAVAFFLLLIFACIAGASASRQWTTEIDLTTRRIRVFRRSFDRWTKTLVDCAFEECTALGTFEYDSDGHLSYDVYVRLENGTRHTIPIASSTLNEAARVASHLSTSTGIPRLDIYAGPIYISPDDNAPRRGS